MRKKSGARRESSTRMRDGGMHGEQSLRDGGFTKSRVRCGMIRVEQNMYSSMYEYVHKNSVAMYVCTVRQPPKSALFQFQKFAIRIESSAFKIG